MNWAIDQFPVFEAVTKTYAFSLGYGDKTKLKFTNMHISSHPQSITGRPADWLENMAKAGFIALGVVYCLVGTLAFMAAFEVGGKTTQDSDQKGAFQFLLEQHYGRFLLGLVALGLVCYTIWRLVQAVLDPEKRGTSAKGIARRLGYASSGLVYGALAFYAANQALGSSSSSGQGDSRQSLARELLQQPFGQWLVGILAVGTILFGVYQIYRALSGKYRRKIQEAKLRSEYKTMLIRSGLAGYIARGVVWILIGYFFLRAALSANAREAGGTGKAFAFLENGTYGSLVLGVVALGLICYGVFCFVRAKCEVIQTPH